MLSLHTGYDTAYLTGAVGQGSDYYTGAPGEPPGYWQGAGAAALGLSGQVDAAVIGALYHDDVGPDGQVLARRQRPGSYPAAAGSLHKRIEAEVAELVAARHGIILPEEVREIRLRLRAQWRTRVPFYDYTFSAPKSVSVLWASLLQAAAEAAAEHRDADAERLTERAGQVRGAVKRASDRMIALAGRRLAYVRTGHHSATSGQWRDAAGFIVASFRQHTNRDGDPQLHVHNAIANRAQRADGADAKWRALHGQPLFKEKLGLGTYGDRFLEQELGNLGWLRTVRRADGNTFEVGGISEEAADVYSDRTKEVADRYRELEAQYVRDHGHAPAKQARWALKQRAALETRDAKEHNPPEPGRELAAWAAKAQRRGIGKLSALREAVTAYAAEHEPGGLPGEAERARALRIAVAEVQRQNAHWSRSQLVFELGRALPALPSGTDPQAYLDELAAEALDGRAEDAPVIRIAPVPDLIDVSRLGSRKDGTSIYRPPGEERFVTPDHLDHESFLVNTAALMPVRQRVTPGQADEALEDTDLDFSQRAAARGLLTTRRLISCLVAPAGTGKTHVIAASARAWTAITGGRVIGLTASENAARVLAGEGLSEAYNIARFLGKIKDSEETRGHVPVYDGDVLVVDEASQVSTADLLLIVQAAQMNGAAVIMAGDPGQLSAVGAGGMFPLIAARHGSWTLTEVRRFRHAWERDASLRLRDGDIGVLAEYDVRGRVYHGPQDWVYDDAVTRWVTDHRQGLDTLLLAASNEEAARLSRLVRERLIERRQVAGRTDIVLSDGNPASTGDLVRARVNTRIDADGQTLANRDTIRIDGWQDGAFERLAVVSRKTGPGQWSRQFFVPAAYLEANGELDYAGNVHVAQGRTVDTGHLVISKGMTRNLLYTGATRGREKNTIHVVTGPPDPAQPTRAEREAYADAGIHKAYQLRQAGDAAAADAVSLRMQPRPTSRQMAPWEAVLAEAMQRDDPGTTALEAMQAAQDYVTCTGHLLELSEAFWRLDVVPQIDEMVRQRIGERDYQRYLKDPERPAFLQALRAHEIGGRPIEDVLDAITARPFDGARSIAAVLHGRTGKEPAPARGATTRWADRLPGGAPQIQAAGQMMDARQAVLGEQLAARPPQWTLEAWGVPPPQPGRLREEWQARAGLVGSYREATGITDPKQAIGPPPAGKAHLAEAFFASVRALELPDEVALLKAMNRGQLEAQVQQYARAEALAPRDVQAQAGDIEHLAEEARARAADAVIAGDTATAGEAQAEAGQRSRELAALSVADAARREWREANAASQAKALAAARELRQRGIDSQIPVTDAEVEGYEQPGAPGPEPETDARRWWKAELAGLHAQMDAEARDLALRYPATDAEVEAAAARQREESVPEAASAVNAATEAQADAEPATPERDRFAAGLAEIREEIERIGDLADQMADQEAERRAQIEQELISEPRVPEPQAEPEIESSWEPGEARRRPEPDATAETADAEPELEL